MNFFCFTANGYAWRSRSTGSAAAAATSSSVLFHVHAGTYEYHSYDHAVSDTFCVKNRKICETQVDFKSSPENSSILCRESL